MKVVAGIALVVAHAAAFTALAQREVPELAVEVEGAPAAAGDALDLRASSSQERAEVHDDASAPGLQRRRWSIAYRGGFSRSVYAAQLVGPYQDPAAPACTGRVAVSQRLLDDGTGSEGTIAGVLARELARELKGLSVWPAGDFQRLDKVSVRWAQLQHHPEDAFTVFAAPYGYVRITARIVLDRVSVPLVLALVPTGVTSELGFHVKARADFAFDNRVVQWVSNKLGGTGYATRLAREQIDGVLLSALSPPPPFAIPGGPTLAFTFCGEPPTIVEGEYGALPFAVHFGSLAAEPQIRPPRRGPAPRLAPAAEVGLDLDLDALNALLFELWRTGYLDTQLGAAGLHETFNADPAVSTLLSLRISPVKLALPPTLAVNGPDTLRLSADARVTIADGPASTTGRIWGAVDLQLAPPLVPTRVNLGELDLACEKTRTLLAPCYGDLVATMRDRSPEFQGPLTSVFTGLLAAIFVERRLGQQGLPADLVIRRATPRLLTTGGNASLHLDLGATLVPAK